MSLSFQGQGEETRKAIEEIPIMLSNVHQRPKTHVKLGLTEIKWGWNIIYWYFLKQLTLFSHFTLAKAHVWGFKFILQDLSEKYCNPYSTSRNYNSLIFFQYLSVQSDSRQLHSDIQLFHWLPEKQNYLTGLVLTSRNMIKEWIKK